MTVNLFGWRSSFKRSLQRIVDAFGSHAVWVCKATHEGNTVVLAQRTPTRLGRSLAQARAREIERLWGLPARRWLGMLKAFDK